MRTAALILSLLWALGCSLAYPCPKSIRAYLAVSLAANVLNEIALYAFGGKDTAGYYASYAVLTSANLLAALNIVRDTLTRKWHAALGLGAAAFVVWRVWALHPWPFYFVLGGILAFAGTCLIFSAGHLPMRDIYATLSALWFAQCVFLMGVGIYQHSELWQKLNFVLPTVFVCGALGFIGLRLREYGRTAAA